MARVLLVLAVALCVGVASADPRAKYVEASKSTVSKSKSTNSGLASTISTTCTTEIEAIKATILEAEKLGGSDLAAQKTQLGDALASRVKGIEALISALQKFELQMSDHVKRTNTVFETRHKQYMEDMSTSALLLKELGLLVAEPSSPGVKKIVLASSTATAKANVTADAPGAVADTARFRGSLVSGLRTAKTALIELSKISSFKQLMEKASATQTPQTCTKAWDHAFTLYKSGHDAHYVNDGFFEKERVALNKHVKLIRELIAQKKTKLAKLKEQLEAVKKAASTPEANIGLQIATSLKVHQNLITGGCASFKSLNDKAAAQKDEVVAQMTACSKADFGKIATVDAGTPSPIALESGAGSAGSPTLVSGTVTHVPDAPATGDMQPMDVVTTGASKTPVTVALAPASGTGTPAGQGSAGGSQ